MRSVRYGSEICNIGWMNSISSAVLLRPPRFIYSDCGSQSFCLYNRWFLQKSYVTSNLVNLRVMVLLSLLTEQLQKGIYRHIFVGDLAADVTDYTLQETFRAHYPSVKGAKVVTGRLTGRTKGYGFVNFGDESEQFRAMTEMNGRLCSTRPMRIGPAANKKNVASQQYPKGHREALSYKGLAMISAENFTL